jgi:2-polyprenyl-3-methyl-5-hydroxy-6-metoxy-1,4-benzoquinol methylase
MKKSYVPSLERNLILLKYIKNKEVLDLGCVDVGKRKLKQKSDIWIHDFIRKNAKYCLGVDANKKGVSYLQKKGYNIIHGNVEKLSLNKKFDVVFAGELIEHLNSPGLFLNSVKRHLKKDGYFILTTPNPFYFMYTVRIVFGADLKINPDHTCWFDPQTIKKLLKNHGFIVEKIEFINKPRWYRLGGIPIKFRKNFASNFMVIAKSR